MLRIFFCLLTLFILEKAFPQKLRVQLDNSSIFISDPIKLSIAFPKDSKKDFLAFTSIGFPEFDNFTKLKTVYEEDKDNKTFKAIQYYKPQAIGISKLSEFFIQSGDSKIFFNGKEVTVKASEHPFSMPYPKEGLEFEGDLPSIKFLISTDKESIYCGESFYLSAALLISEDNKGLWNYKNLAQQVRSVSKVLYPANCTIDPYSKGMIENPKYDTVNIKGKTYKRLTIFEGKYYPILSGTIKIPATEFSVISYKTAKIVNGRWWKAENLTLKSPSVTIKAKELPSHPLRDVVPVGVFQLKESISTNKLTAGKSFNYTSIIQGNGNMNAVLPIESGENDVFEIYTPKVSQRTIKDNNLFAGKIFTFEIIPKEPGIYPLGNYFKWIYFNTETNQYDTLASRYTVSVAGESQKNKDISSTVLGSFYELAEKESNKLRSKEKEESIKFFANIIILFMLVTTAILVFKR